MKKSFIPISFLERFGNAVDDTRYWLVHTLRLGSLMAKGAYLVNERKRLLQRLGERVYEMAKNGVVVSPDLESEFHEIERLTKKVEIEEMLIRRLRFGERRTRKSTVVQQPVRKEGTP